MSFAPAERLLASTSFRLALVCAAVILIAFAATGFGLWFVTKSAAERAGRQRIAIEMESLQDEIRDEGLGAAIAAIETRQRAPGALDYRLIGPDGRILTGDLQVDPPAIGWSTAYLPNAGRAPGPDLIILHQPLPNGGALFIAEDLEHTEGVRYEIMSTLIWIGAAALLLAVAAGFFAARSALRQMDGIVSVMQRVSGGDLSARAAPGATRTDIDLLGQRINAMLAHIDSLVGNLRRVSNDIAHDLRTPLAHVRQQLDDVANAASLDEAKSGARNAQDKIDEVMRIFAAVLRLAEIEAGAAQSRFTTLELDALIERVADAYRPDIESEGGALHIDLSPVSITGDADLLAQAVGNLLENAMRHAHASTITVSLRNDAHGATMIVQDRGPGVPAAEHARVLEPFVRLDRSRKSPGAGLGLSIVNAIARLHNAGVVLTDAAPGLRVEIKWPRKPAMAPHG
jgi:signal transduction histidine kinase